MNKTRKQIESDHNHPFKPPQLFAWFASVVTMTLVIAAQFLPRGDNPVLKGTGVFMLLLSGFFIFTPFYLLSKHGGGKADRTYMQAGKIVDQGLYAITRHPQYLGYMLLACGFALLSQHWAAFLLAIIGASLFYFQAVQEEKHCLAQFGEPYVQYLQRVPRCNILLGILRLLQRRHVLVELKKASKHDVEALTETQIRTFVDDNKLKPPGCSMEGPPGYNSVKWNTHWLGNTPYYKILSNGKIVGGLILFDLGDDQFEVGRIWVDPVFQNQGIGQAAMKSMFHLHPDVKKWILGTPSWAVRNQHFYEKMGFVKIRETEIDPNLGWSGIEYELCCD